MNQAATKKEIYLDLDGVCVDFIRAAIAAHGFDPDVVMARWAAKHRGEFFPYNVLGMEMDSFWDHLATLGEPFWAGLEEYPWFERLYTHLGEIGHVIFCTSATRSPSCLSGKLHWIQDRFGVEFQDYIITSHKDRLAHGSAYLIDDFDRNVEMFDERGGVGVLFPQMWNSNHSIQTDPVDYVIARILER